MPQLRIDAPVFLSRFDEAAFFAWLGSIAGVEEVTGDVAALVVRLRSARVPERTLRELIALLWRYGVPMRELGVFETEWNREWFRSPRAYWHRAVFVGGGGFSKSEGKGARSETSPRAAQSRRRGQRLRR